MRSSVDHLEDRTLTDFPPELLQHILLYSASQSTAEEGNQLKLVSQHLYANTKKIQERLGVEALRVLSADIPDFEDVKHAKEILKNMQHVFFWSVPEWSNDTAMIFRLVRGVFDCLNYLNIHDNTFSFNIINFLDRVMPDGVALNDREFIPYADVRVNIVRMVQMREHPQVMFNMMSELKEQLKRNHPPLDWALSFFKPALAEKGRIINMADQILSKLSIILKKACLQHGYEEPTDCVGCRFM